MTLAAILVFYFLALGPSDSPQDQAAPASQTETTPAQKSTPSTPANSKPKPRHKKVSNPCNPSASTTKSGDAHGSPAAPTSANAQKPCPPPKKVVVNGGSDEPTVNLNADTSPEKASNERSSAEQLSQATEENLKKIAGKPLSSDQQDMVSQIKQFMDQSKAAVAEGDLERARNLAEKARLLSDELVKP